MTTRIYLIGLMILLLTSCAPAAETPEAAVVSPLQVILVSADFAVGEPRISFAVLDGETAATNISDIRISAVELGEDLTASDMAPSWTGEAIGYTDYEIPYWVFYPQLERPGYWGMIAEMDQTDGTTTRADFVVEVQPTSKAPAIGATAPASHNRTLATEPDISLLTSANDPDPALYQLTVADAIATGRPTVVGFLTPAFCQTKWCAPVLNSLEAARASTGDAVNYIHIEVYDDFQKLTVVDEMAEWGLETEPWVFVLDGNGQVVNKFSGPLSPAELLAALESLS
ncbi:MAG: hypothetical protein KC410_08750 [Anaerolineales bacterium]|uniref:TlpA family protein disulfide reductase n=1 Tax=Promineifilum sp. TaxID=2664178 RepID=UPI001DD543DF|nr:hypothetical protein [Anaerolineales bacterium]MCO5178759.1 hypothetical protein [Promineifilum sp.]